MYDVLSFIQDVDLATPVGRLMETVDATDPLFLGLVVMIVVGIGHKLACLHRGVYGWGLRLGVAAFLLHGGIGMFRAGGLENATVAQASRSAIVGGAVLGLSWISLPLILFLYRYFRFGLVAFLAYGGYALLMAGSFESEEMSGVALRGAAVSLLTMLVAWVFQPVWDVLRTRSVPAAPPAIIPFDAGRRNLRHDAPPIEEPATYPIPAAASVPLDELHAWFMDEQRRIRGLELPITAKEQKLLDLQELYFSLSQRFLGESGVRAASRAPRRVLAIAE